MRDPIARATRLPARPDCPLPARSSDGTDPVTARNTIGRRTTFSACVPNKLNPDYASCLAKLVRVQKKNIDAGAEDRDGSE
jgi:hypothetical protein